ncbi:hypothetical protein [Actinomadura rugatobispora]|uniref:WYL domain-containing protein n=1 Tax=Actinomadura rugatobispora TaxID=1994 RepID=A0ABW1AIG7_9ACTN|nr:hypothetical protein GCM10010200_057460 [Actinomadura rugatobispora]
MTEDLLVNLVATGIAFTLGVSVRSIRQRVRSVRRAGGSRRVQEQRHPRFTHGWLLEYYLSRDRLDDLYLLIEGRRRRFVPFLTKPSWTDHGFAEGALIVQSHPQRRSEAPVDQAVMSRRAAYLNVVREDGEPWNDLIAVVQKIRETPDGPRIEIALAEYFQFLSACGALEDETYAAVRSPKNATPIRDATLAGVDDAAEARRQAHGFGMQCAFVFEEDGRHRVLVQRRSHSVSIYGGALAVVPVFGCQSMDLSERTPVSIFHNFLREVYEELYGGTEVERRGNRVDPTWFYREPPIARLITAQEDGVLDFRIFGFGFDALNGEVDICGLAYVKDPEFARRELPVLRANWEIHEISVWDLFGDDLTEALFAGEFSPGSVYTLAETRRYLAGRADGE